MTRTAKLYGTTYTVETVNGYPDELLLTGPRGAGYLLQPVLSHPGIFILNSMTSGEKRVKGNRAYVAVIGEEIMEAGLAHLDPEVAAAAELAILPAETPEATTTDWDEALADLLVEEEAKSIRTAAKAARNLDAEIQDHLAGSAALAGLKAQVLAGVEAGLDEQAAYVAAVAAMIAVDRPGMLTLIRYERAGRLRELNG